MALHRGIQSAIFYYVSCAPCSEARVRKRRKQQAERDRADRAALELHMPGLYRHPEPSSTNPYWQAEIDAGPIPSRVKKRQVESNRAANSTKSNIASSVSVTDHGDVDMQRSDSAKSGLGVVQRPDEALWGDVSGTNTPPPSSVSSEGLPRRLPRAKISTSATARTYSNGRNAAINDLHPPTTRKVDSREDVMWMLQPPPLPEVMNGKTTQSVQRQTSNISRPRTTSRSTTSSGNGMSLPSTSHSPAKRTSPSRPEDLSLLYPTRSIDRARAKPPNDQYFQSSTMISRPVPSFQVQDGVNAGRRKTSRSHLSVLPRAENEEPQRASSFNTGVSRHDHAAQSSPKPTTSNWVWTPSTMPHDDALEDHTSEANTPANFDAWQASEEEFPQWIHDHTRREVRQRWSFDM